MEGPAVHIQVRLSNMDWEDVYPRLLLYAARLCHRYGLYACNGGIEPKELVQETICRVLIGQRNCKEDLDLFWCLCGVIWSLASHAAEKCGRTIGANMDGFGTTLANDELIEDIYNCLKGEQLLTDIAKLYIEDVGMKPKEIYKAIKGKYPGIHRPRVDRARGRLRQELRKCLKRGGWF